MPIILAPDAARKIAMFLKNSDLKTLTCLRPFRHAAAEELIKRELVNYQNTALSELEKKFIICAKLGITEWVAK